MKPNPILFRDLTYIFLAAVFGGLVAWRLHLPLILGFVIGGIAISPFTPGPHLSDLHTFEVLAEVGVVLLMFSIGVEFSIPDLMRVKWVALIGGPIGILLMLGIAIGAGKLLGWSATEGFVLGAAVSVASTMVLARLLRYGKANHNPRPRDDRHYSRGRSRSDLHDGCDSGIRQLQKWRLADGGVGSRQGHSLTHPVDLSCDESDSPFSPPRQEN